MSGFRERWNDWKERMRQHYRLVVMNSDTFEEVGTYNLSLLNVYTWLSALFVVSALIVVLLILYSPFGRLIPGVNTAIDKREMLALTQEIDSLHNVVRANELYTRDIKAVLTGQVESEEDLAKAEVNFPESKSETSPNQAEEAIREEVALEEIQSKVQNTELQPGFTNNSRLLEQLYFTPPVSGEISSSFNPSIDHYGVDVLAPKNTPIKAIMEGVVIQSEWSVEYGHSIGVQHGNSVLSFYKHNSSLLKKIGDKVKAGEVIAIIGNSGELTNGPHLHFELWSQGAPVDPVSYINFN